MAKSTECHRRPDKRQLHQLRALADEIGKLKGVNKWQLGMTSNFSSLCDPSTYTKAPLLRRQQYVLEAGLLLSSHRALEDQRRRFNEMLGECESLGQFVLHATEIEKDDLNKTILAFTIVTIIFLPLSFVTSYLGMNTTFADGDFEATQALFWKIALPLTVALGLFCLALAFWEKSAAWVKERVGAATAVAVAPPPLRERNAEGEKPLRGALRRRVTFADEANRRASEV